MSSISSCVHPLKAWTIGVKENGKKDLKITSFDVDYGLQPIGGGSISWHKGSLQSSFIPGLKVLSDYQEIPCGHCVACRLRASRQWADRMSCEAVTTPPAYFWTLTYSDQFVPLSSYVDFSTGEVLPSKTLQKAFFQKFMKRLRRHFPDYNIRFFACGEYGSKTHRPHYHMITFGLPLENLVLVKQSSLGYNLFSSQELLDLWSDPVTHENLGFVLVSEANWQTMAYVSRYVTKKLGKSKDIDQEYLDRGEEPEFALMSRRPGIGHDYFMQNKDDLYDFDAFYLRVGDQSKKIFNPKYFDYLMEIEDADFMAERKDEIRQRMENKKQEMLKKTDRDYQEVLADDEHIITERINKLKRGLD